VSAGPAVRIVNLDRGDLSAGRQEELARLVDGGDPSGFHPARTPFLGTFALAAAAAAAALLVWTAVRVSRNSFPLEEPMLSLTTLLTAVALFAVGLFCLKAGAALAAGRWRGWCNASFGLVRLEGRRVTVYPWSLVSGGRFQAVRASTHSGAGTGRTGLADPRSAGAADRSGPVKDRAGSSRSREWVMEVRAPEGERSVSIRASDPEAFGQFLKGYGLHLSAYADSPESLPAPGRTPLPMAVWIALIALASLALAPLAVRFVASPAMDRALLARDLREPEAHDPQGLRTERLLADYPDRLTDAQKSLLQSNWRRVCQREAMENRKRMMDGDNGAAKAALIAVVERSEKLAPSAGGAGELALLRADPGDNADTWRAWTAGLLEKTLRAAVDGPIPADFDLSYDDVFDLTEGLSALLLRADSPSGFRIIVKRRIPGMQDEQAYADLAEAEVRSLVRLLVEIEAWKPQAAGASPGAGERRASLKVTAGSLPRQWVVPHAEMNPDSGAGRVRAWLEGFLKSHAARPEKGP